MSEGRIISFVIMIIVIFFLTPESTAKEPLHENSEAEKREIDEPRKDVLDLNGKAPATNLTPILKTEDDGVSISSGMSTASRKKKVAFGKKVEYEDGDKGKLKKGDYSPKGLLASTKATLLKKDPKKPEGAEGRRPIMLSDKYGPYYDDK